MGWFSHYLCSYIFELLQYTEHMAHASTILVMEGIRAGWNKALRTILLLEWKEAPEQNCAVCWALTAELEFSGGRKGPLRPSSYYALKKEHKKKKKKKAAKDFSITGKLIELQASR